jgi:hypothetical protein
MRYLRPLARWPAKQLLPLRPTAANSQLRTINQAIAVETSSPTGATTSGAGVVADVVAGAAVVGSGARSRFCELDLQW